MSVEYIRNRESHLTNTSDSYYKEVYKISKSDVESLSVGDLVCVVCVDGTKIISVVTSKDPFIVTAYDPILLKKEIQDA